MIKVIVNKACARCVLSELLTSGMVGQTINFDYSADFDGLEITAVFTNGKTTVNVVAPGTECVIPHQVLSTPGTTVSVGIYAVNGDTLVIPTVYATVGIVLKGADPSGDVSADPTLPVWAQIQALMGNLNDLNTEAKNNLVAAINEAAQSGGGGGSTSIAMRVDGGYIQYSTDKGKTWVNLIAEADLKGTDGVTPDIQIGQVTTLEASADATASISGTAENPLLNLGIPKGADGAGMDITGAKVGQIAKIAAVDASGVPTAWSPVDMPSGGGEKWELIDVIPLTAGVTLYDIANLSKYRKIAISVLKPITTEGSESAFIRIYKLSNTTLSALSYNISSGFFKSAYGYIELAKDGAFMRWTELYRNNRATPANGGVGIPIDGLDLDDLGEVKILLPEAYSQNFDGTGTMTIRGIK